MSSPPLAALDQRARNIFQKLVELYLETGEPVGSRTISRVLPSHLSAASVRNVMADLEESGLIFSPHVSSGRIPTHLGLRFFVDTLVNFTPISKEDALQIEENISCQQKGANSFEEAFIGATEILSGLSRCAGVVIIQKKNVRLRHLEFVPLAPGRALVVLVGEDGSVENRTIEIPPDVLSSSLVQASHLLSTHFQGKTISEISDFLKTETSLLQKELDDLSSKVIEAGLAVWSDDHAHKKLIVRGQSHLIDTSADERDLEKIRSLFKILEEKEELVRLLGLAETAEGVRIFIGSENTLFPLSGSSLILSPYRHEDDHTVGVLGVIGPTRLDYGRIIPIVEYTARILSKALS